MRLRSTAAAGVLFAAALSFGTGTAHAADLYNCDDFTYQEDAQDYFNTDVSDPSQLDDDDDSIACETRPHRPAGVAPAAATSSSTGGTSSTSGQVSTRPVGAVAAGDGSSSADASALPYVLGGLAFAGAGGAALAARRTRSAA